VVQRIYKEQWNSRPKPVKVFYLTRCYRYERPQAGRYREFWQFGVEWLGPKKDGDKEDVIQTLQDMMFWTPGIDQMVFKESVKRGLDYYIEDGFEMEVPYLGAQKQVAGGGRYADGIGFAIGVDRIMLAQDLADKK
jgi:histidyl-tRNA synthetase